MEDYRDKPHLLLNHPVLLVGDGNTRKDHITKVLPHSLHVSSGYIYNWEGECLNDNQFPKLTLIPMEKETLLSFKDNTELLKGRKVLIEISHLGKSNRLIAPIKSVTSHSIKCSTRLAGDMEFHLSGELVGTKSKKYRSDKMNWGNSTTATLLTEIEAETISQEWKKKKKDQKLKLQFIISNIPKANEETLEEIYKLLTKNPDKNV